MEKRLRPIRANVFFRIPCRAVRKGNGKFEKQDGNVASVRKPV